MIAKELAVECPYKDCGRVLNVRAPGWLQSGNLPPKNITQPHCPECRKPVEFIYFMSNSLGQVFPDLIDVQAYTPRGGDES